MNKQKIIIDKIIIATCITAAFSVVFLAAFGGGLLLSTYDPGTRFLPSLLLLLLFLLGMSGVIFLLTENAYDIFKGQTSVAKE